MSGSTPVIEPGSVCAEDTVCVHCASMESQNHSTQVEKDLCPNLSWEREPRGEAYLLLSISQLDVLQHMLVWSWLLVTVIQRIDNSRLETYRNRMENSRMPQRMEICF